MLEPKSFSPSRTILTSFTPRKPAAGEFDATSTSWIADPQLTTDSQDSTGDWILNAAVSGGPLTPAGTHPTIACGMSNGEIQVYDQERLHLLSSFLPENSNFIATDVGYGPQNTIVSSGYDGTVSLFDLRSSKAELTLSLPSSEIALSVSLGFDGYLAAAASHKGLVHFYDLRSRGSLLGSYVDAHTDEVTKVRFFPYSSYLLSAAEDGLVCLFDTTQPTEEQAIKNIFNIGSTPRNIGFCGNTSTIYCLSGNESISFWNAETGSCMKDFGNTFRDSLKQITGGRTPVDFLVDAHWDGSKQELLLMTGGDCGDVSIFSISKDLTGVSHQCSLVNGHRGVVRAWGLLARAGTFITAGEDARLCEWDTSQNSFTPTIYLPTPQECGRGKRRTAISPPDRLERRQRIKQSLPSP